MIDYEFATRWNLALGIGLVSMWVVWAFLLYDDVRAWVKSWEGKNTVNCPFCRKMHAPGDCARDKTPDGGE